MADKGEKRPSFSAFVKKSRDSISSRIKGKKPTEDEAGSSSTSPSAAAPGADDDKARAQARRAQVRRAQIQHRQRKAEYVKQLEMDVNAYRYMIARAEAEAGVVRRENELLRRKLAEGLPVPAPAALPVPPLHEVEMFGGVDVGDLIVTLGMDDALGAPCFHITSSSSGESLPLADDAGASPLPRKTQTGPDSDSGRDRAGVVLTAEQEMAAVNFILALEHVCWDHFSVGDFPGHRHHREQGMGHALMATTFCMSHAPESFYEARRVFGDTMMAEDDGMMMEESMLPDDDLVPPPEKENHGSAVEKAEAAVGHKSKSPEPMQWKTPERISLAALEGLASSLNPGDLELTPVQAWFELAARYPAGVLLRADVLSALKVELKGVVRCVYYGAAMERGAFESVVQRVFAQFGYQ
ncbi:hypothetical protein N3K66_002516 [Trichothecium roseum]|uniref:Uncharacterized protein n=1 Tax=Trichothecium roseum TaxID=47278 RepID=A0ACC0VAE3_9HYPO|nr:hypothetical protein N3K66_002516 [Trichothecium roseum]